MSEHTDKRDAMVAEIVSALLASNESARLQRIVQIGNRIQITGPDGTVYNALVTVACGQGNWRNAFKR